MLKIVDYGSGNISAVCNIYKALGVDFKVASVPGDLRGASKLILPGVGAFDKTMMLLSETGFRERLDELVLYGLVPVLGVCVGMQIMANRSEEGVLPGLGWIDGEVTRIPTSELDAKPKLPHMGWNSIAPEMSHPIFEAVDFDFGFYFLHSFRFQCKSKQNVLSTTVYGEKFASSVVRDNILGFQFHPEKSHGNGVKLFENFARF